MLIKDLPPRLYEQGKIKIGMKDKKIQTGNSGNDYQRPVKVDYMFLTTMEKDEYNNFVIDTEMTNQVQIEGEPGKAKLIGPCVFLFDELENNIYSAYCSRSKNSIFCRGDGVTANRQEENKDAKEITCNPETCEIYQKKRCKPTCVLSVVFPDAPRSGGCYKFRSSGFYSVQALQSGLAYFHKWTQGAMAGIPFNLRINKGEANVEGRAISYYFLSIEHDASLRILIESPARLQIPESLPVPDVAEQVKMLEDEAGEDLDEFHPQHKVTDTGLVTDLDGDVVDEIADPEPQGAGAFKDTPEPEKPKDPKKEDPQREKLLKDVEDSRVMYLNLFAMSAMPEKKKVEDLIKEVAPKAKCFNDMTNEELMETVSMFLGEMAIMREYKVPITETEARKDAQDPHDEDLPEEDEEDGRIY